MAREHILTAPIQFDRVRLIVAVDTPVERLARFQWETGYVNDEGAWVRAPDQFNGSISYTGEAYNTLSVLGPLATVYDYVYQDLVTRGLIGAGLQQEYGQPSSSSSSA